MGTSARSRTRHAPDIAKVWTPGYIPRGCSVSSVRSGQWDTQHEQRAQGWCRGFDLGVLDRQREKFGPREIEEHLLQTETEDKPVVFRSRICNGLFDRCGDDTRCAVLESRTGWRILRQCALHTNRYVCGRWPDEHPMAESENSWFTERSSHVTLKVREHLRKNFTEAEVPWAILQAKKLYDSCTDIASIDSLGLKPLLRLLERVDLPQIPAALTGKHGNLVALMARVRRVLGKDVFIGFNVGTDPRDKSRNIVYLDTPSPESPFPSYNAEMERRMKRVESRSETARGEPDETEKSRASVEISYVADVIREIVTNGTASNCSYVRDETAVLLERRIEKAAGTIYELSGEFSDLCEPDVNETIFIADDGAEEVEYMLIDDLQRETDRYVLKMNDSLAPRQIWRPFLEELFRGVGGFDPARDEVVVGDLEYLRQVAYLLDTTDDVDLETAIWWIVVDIVVPHSSKKLRQLWHEYVQKVIDYESREPLSLYCADLVNTMMGMAVSWLFVDREFNEKEGIKVAEMLEDIRSAFASIVQTADWMDQRTKLATLEKASKMTYVIGHPDWLFEKGMIDEYYEGIDMRDDSYLENMLSLINAGSRAEREQIKTTNLENETSWVADPTDVNALHSFIINRITVPEAILQFPFYELGLEALNYGAIGTILGHELTHGFDNVGRLYDVDGHKRQWWSNSTIRYYNDKVECFVKHYSSYYVDEVDEYVDGDLTLGENIADNGGLREAVLAYEKWKARHGQEPILPGFANLTHEQLVFLGFAHLWCGEDTPESLRWQLHDTHSPLQVRLHGVLRNSPEFSKAWNCPLGSVMNPERKCKIW